MYKKPILLISFVLVLGLAGSASGSLVAHWRLDEVTGLTASDSSGNGHDGTLVNGPVWVTGYFDGALNFDGSDDYVDIGYSPGLSLNEFTVSAWVNIAAEPGSFGVFGTRIGGDFTFDLKVNDTLIHGDIGNGSAWINVAIDITSTDTGTNGQGGDLTVDTWYMITYVIDNTNQRVRLYLDADLKRNITISGAPLLMKAGQSMRIGHTGYGTEWMNGLMDDVRIYDNALLQTEIGAIMLGEDRWNARNPDPAHLAVDVPIDA
ncbi:MAG: LamG domain-containing protein, partial [Planctomycetota bacterium]